MSLPAFNENGDLPPGVHSATLAEVIARFGQGPVQRVAVADRLTRLYQLVTSTGQVARVAVFGSSAMCGQSALPVAPTTIIDGKTGHGYCWKRRQQKHLDLPTAAHRE